MNRIIMMVIRNILLVPFMWCKLCYRAAHADKYTDEEHFKFLKYIVYRANKCGNVKIESHGVEKLPKENGFMITPNHQGLYDTLALMDAINTPFSVVSKKEMENVPFVKQIFACIQAIMLDRDDPRQAIKVIMSTADEIKKGRNYVIFPEGTRSKQGNKLGKFKGGTFKIATKAKCPIVPVALVDSFKPFDSKSISQCTVQVHFLDPLYYEDYKGMSTNEIAELVETRIQETVDQNVR